MKPKRLIIAGSRDLKLRYPLAVSDFVNFFLEGDRPEEVVSGGATGIDAAGEEYAGARLIPVKKFEADWYANGKAAGPIRNKQMAKYADALLLIWDGESRGSHNMKEEMLKLGKPVFEVILAVHNEK